MDTVIRCKLVSPCNCRCIRTRLFTPKFLSIQKRVKEEKINVRLAKIECAVDKEVFCMANYKVDGFPTILTYVDGKLKEEYYGETEEGPFYQYIKTQVRLYESTKLANGKKVDVPAQPNSSPVMASSVGPVTLQPVTEKYLSPENSSANADVTQVGNNAAPIAALAAGVYKSNFRETQRR
jgi:Thioredoxin